ncbi:MBL fold metallo-hydrolase [Cohnella yongneupensis]|uniref:MBL fold metallo-hydrolase n=1 Tax=Cohnella yongneupensis TaxID=425006 RepID=A0ABW0R6B0_9BACL
MDLNVQMLGTGSAFAKANYNNNAMITAGGQTLLIDCGITAPLALHELGRTFNEIDAVLLTHIHADHIGGLEEFAFQMKFIYGRKPRLYIADTLVEQLWECSLKGGLYQDENPTLASYFDVYPIAEGTSVEVLPELRIKLLATAHIPNKPNYSLIINDHFFYSGDTVFNQDLLHSLVQEQQVRLIFHDCQLHPPGIVHACLSQLLTLPASIQELTYLMHYGDDKPEFVGRTGLMRFIDQHVVYHIDPLNFTVNPL